MLVVELRFEFIEFIIEGLVFYCISFLLGSFVVWVGFDFFMCFWFIISRRVIFYVFILIFYFLDIFDILGRYKG